MANSDLPRGAIPVKHRNGAPFTGPLTMLYVPSSYGTAIFRGDPIILVTDSSDANGIQAVNVASAGGGAYISGFCVGPATGGDPPIPVLQDDAQYHKASTEGYIYACLDPEVLFEIQEDGVGGAMGVGAVGRNADLIAGTGSTATGYSGWELDSNTLDTTATLQMRIVEAVARVDNDPTLTNAKWLASINLHALIHTTGI